MKIQIKGKQFEVETAETHEEKREGLSNQEEFDKGMLFFFDEERYHSFHMTNTKFGLDILFLDNNKQVVDIKEGDALQLERIRNDRPAQYVLEMEKGFVEEHSISIGDSFEFIEESNMHEKIEKYLNDEIEVEELLEQRTDFTKTLSRELNKVAREIVQRQPLGFALTATSTGDVIAGELLLEKAGEERSLVIHIDFSEQDRGIDSFSYDLIWMLREGPGIGTDILQRSTLSGVGLGELKRDLRRVLEDFTSRFSVV